MTHPLARTPTTATECLREALDGIDDCAAIVATARGKCARQLREELEEKFSDSEEMDQFLEATDGGELASEWRHIKDWHAAGQKIGKRAVHLGEALDIIEDVQGGLERLRGVVDDGLYTARTTPPATPNPVGMVATASATFGAGEDS